MAWLVDPAILERVKRLELPWSRDGVDPYGARQEDVARMYTILGWMYHRYFRVSVDGLAYVPLRGRVMLVGNHSGGWALDALMVLASLFFELEPPRLAHGMAEKFLIKLPIVSQMTQRSGHLAGLPEHAVRLLRDERMVMVFPEGARGTAKLYKQRHSLVRFGTGFMRLAMETQTPIVPFGFAGGGEAVPTVLNLVKLGKLMGVPYLPVTPWIVPVPLPLVRLHVEYGAPMHFPGTGNEPDEDIEERVDEVKGRIADLIGRAAEARARKVALVRKEKTA